MKLKDLNAELDRIMPTSTSCEWDNDGIMCADSYDREVRRVLLALDITEYNVEFAHENHFDTIISHHPLVFRGQKSLKPSVLTQRKLIALIKYNIAALSFHTRFDCLESGVNDTLAALIELENVRKFGDSEAPDVGRIGELRCPVPSDELALKVKSLTGAPFVNLSKKAVCKRVAVLGGSGDDFIEAASAAGADTLITGTVGYHNMTDAADGELTIIEAGHFYTENTAMPAMKAILLTIDSGLEIEILNYHPIITL